MDEQFIEKLNKYLQALTVAQQNAHILHWNVVGNGFRSAHLQFQDVYKNFFDRTDEIAELIRIHDGIPVASLTDCIEGSNIQEISSKQTFKVQNALKMCLEDVKDIIEICNDVAVYASENNIIDACDLLGVHSSNFGKLKYFLDSMVSEEGENEHRMAPHNDNFHDLKDDKSDHIMNPGADYERPDAPGKPEVPVKPESDNEIKDFRK